MKRRQTIARPGPALAIVHRFPNLPDVRCRGEALGAPVYWLGLQWAVTADGVECRDGTYAITKDRVWEDEDGPL